MQSRKIEAKRTPQNGKKRKSDKKEVRKVDKDSAKDIASEEDNDKRDDDRVHGDEDESQGHNKSQGQSVVLDQVKCEESSYSPS